MRRREFLGALGGLTAAWPLAARGQQPMPVIGVLGSASAAAYGERLTLIRQALADAGLAEGRNIAMEYRWAEGQLDRLPVLAAELAGRKVNVIIATGGVQAPRAAMSATRTIPIVFSTDATRQTTGSACLWWGWLSAIARWRRSRKAERWACSVYG
jgi:putative ABC transport system substrate-binding protein